MVSVALFISIQLSMHATVVSITVQSALTLRLDALHDWIYSLCQCDIHVIENMACNYKL